jgi:hypothetical protein
VTTDTEAREAAAIREATAALRRAAWRLEGTTRRVREAEKLAESNRDGLRQVRDELAPLFRLARPKLQVVKEDDDA